MVVLFTSGRTVMSKMSLRLLTLISPSLWKVLEESVPPGVVGQAAGSSEQERQHCL